MDYKKLYMKYKMKYLNMTYKIEKILKKKHINGGGLTEYMMESIEKIDDNDITIEEIIEGDKSKSQNLIIIPGFSDASYISNYKTLLEWYDTKLNINNYNKIIFIKFSKKIKDLSVEIFRDGKIIDGNLENYIYNKSAEIINDKIKKLKLGGKIIILGKSAGGGVALYLTTKMKTKHLFLFAPGVKYINMDEKIILKDVLISIGWNSDDNKVKYDIIWPELRQKIDPINNNIYEKNIKEEIDTRHEINTKFIELINANIY
jgi:hypothetical protein